MPGYTKSPNRAALLFLAGVMQNVEGELDSDEKAVFDRLQGDALKIADLSESIHFQKTASLQMGKLQKLGAALDKWRKWEKKKSVVSGFYVQKLTDELEQIEKRSPFHRSGDIQF